MSDLLIFGFGLAVTLVVSSGLTSLIVIKNRINEAEAEAAEREHTETR